MSIYSVILQDLKKQFLFFGRLFETELKRDNTHVY